MLRILRKCGFENSESFATSTGIFVSAVTKDSDVVTMIKRVKTRSNNLQKIASVNEISRHFTEGKLNVAEAFEKLEKIRDMPPYPTWVKVTGAAAIGFCFTAMLGGNLEDSLNAFVSASLMQIIFLLLEKHGVAAVLRNICGGASAALFAIILLNLGIGRNIDPIIIGSIMPLVPGLILTNAIRDILEGDFLSGSARILDAVLVAVAIATGVGISMNLWYRFIGGIAL